MNDNYFYGLEGNKLFKVYVENDAFHGARIASYIYNEKMARASSRGLGFPALLILSLAAKKAVKKRAELEAKYDVMALGSLRFRESDKANFTLVGTDVLGATIKPKPTGFRSAFSPGAQLEFALGTGKKRKFVLIEDQNVAFVKNLVSGVVSNTLMVE